MCSREKDVPALASDAKGVADRRPAALAPSAAPSGPPLMTTSAMAMDLVDTAPETLKTALSLPLPDSEDESSTAPQPRGRSGKQKRRATAATSAVRSSPIEKRDKQDFAPDADGFVPAERTARRMQLSTTLPTAVANSFDALADAPDQLPRDPAPKKDSHLPPVVLQFRPPYGELQKLLRSWTTAVYTVKPAGRDLYRVPLRTADDYRRVTQEPSERDVLNAPAPTQEVRAPVRPLRSRLVHSVAVLTWPAIVGVKCGSVPSLANVAKHQRHIRRSQQRDGPASLSRRQPASGGPGYCLSRPDGQTAPRQSPARGQRPVGTQRSAPSVEQPQVDSPSESATPPPSSDGAAPAASTADLANLVAQRTALVTSATKLIEALSQQLTAAVPLASPAPTAVNTHQLHHGQR
ncbi:uncharacterized protein LOC126334559 [Schistocerca gregaria]|uniref:uncharacterized protein LOC126334559 n=1 Tax=Schistocerca gregaria TaxID=7010 RepID=UPI00211EA9E7|nr:uncharacterized protein LOC126334559 [Schistocerca gregaria]